MKNMLPVSAALLSVIRAQDEYYEFLEDNGIDPENPDYNAVKDARDAAVVDFEAGLAAFVGAQR